MENVSSAIAISVRNILAQSTINAPDGRTRNRTNPAAREAERKEMTALLSRVNVTAFLARASFLRNGVPCTTPQQSFQCDRSTRSSVMGGIKYHIEIQFEDGISWLARIRRVNATSPPADLRAYNMRSEVATLQFLRSKPKVPVAEVYDYNLDGKNPIEVEYILMEKLAGQLLRWSLLSSAPEQRKKVMSQLADTYIELQRFSFDLMGSFDRPGTEHVGSFARESLTDYKDSRMLPLGLFASSEEYFITSIQLTLDLIMREECFTPQAIDAYLIHRFLLDSVPKELLSRRDD